MLPRIDRWARRPGPERQAAGEALSAAAEDGAAWLFHPLCYALFATEPSPKDDVQLLVWTGTHAPDALPEIAVEEPLWLWSGAGGFPIAPGRHHVANLASEVAANPSPLPIALDLWFESAAPAGDLPLGFDPERLWRGRRPLDEATTEAIERDVVRFFRTQSLLAARLPAFAGWLEGVTHVVVPFRPSEVGAFNSSSQPELPGLIFTDVRAEAEIAEALAHESAHHYFRLYEATAPLIEPGHEDTYASPLRPEPRPLRGVFLAYHALAYICALFAESARLGGRWLHPGEMADLRQRAAEAEATLSKARAHLTGAGREFFERTREVAAYGA